MNKVFVFLSVLIFVFAIVLVDLSRPQYKVTEQIVTITPTPTLNMFELVNKERSNAGLKQLTYSKILEASALAKCNDLLIKDYWAHNAPDGTEPWIFFNNAGYKYRYAGENLAQGFASDQHAMVGLMASILHKENILKTEFKEIGIGRCESPRRKIIVQHFGTRQK